MIRTSSAVIAVWLAACSDTGAAPDPGASAGRSGATSGGSGLAPGGSVNGGTASGGGASGGTASGDSAAGGAASGAAGSGAAAGSGGQGAGGNDHGGDGSGGEDGEPLPNLPPGVSALFPRPAQGGVCVDAPLRLSFASAPSLGSQGKLRVHDEVSDELVGEVDFAAMQVQRRFGGQTYQLPRPVYLDGSDVVVLLDSDALSYGKQYYVTLDRGAIVPQAGELSVSRSDGWRFGTRPSPASGSNLRVALDGSGDFCSWQGALDAVPAGNTTPVTIDVGRGHYHGLVYFNGKQNVTVRGASRAETIFSGVNNEKLNPGTRLRALVGADGASGLVLQSLSLRNLTPQGGSQAEALRLQNCDRCVLKDVALASLQDTLLFSGRLYARDCAISGNVDYIWGEGAAYFDRCEIKTVGRSGYIVQSRNGQSGYGYVFVDSQITSDPGISGSVLARIDVSEYPHSHVAFVDCTVGPHISRAGWTVTGGAAPTSLRFWEYRSRDSSGALIDVSGRASGEQLSADQAARMRDPKVVLGGWQPPP